MPHSCMSAPAAARKPILQPPRDRCTKGCETGTPECAPGLFIPPNASVDGVYFRQNPTRGDHMLLRISIALASAGLATSFAAQQPPAFTTINDPATTDGTYPAGINAEGKV